MIFTIIGFFLKNRKALELLDKISNLLAKTTGLYNERQMNLKLMIIGHFEFFEHCPKNILYFRGILRSWSLMTNQGK